MSLVRPVNTHDLHRLAHQAEAESKGDAFRKRAFHAYHAERLNVADPAVLLRIALAAGLRAAEVSDVLASDRHGGAVRADQLRAGTLGIVAVPALRFEDGSMLSPNSPRITEAMIAGSAPLDRVQA